MRIGLDLRSNDPSACIETAIEADRLGIWAVLVTAAPGAESALAAEMVVATDHVHVAVQFDASTTHPLGIAEEVAILDHLSARRTIAVIEGATDENFDHARRLLAGEIVDNVALTPPPAQTMVPTWKTDSLATLALPHSLDEARTAIDAERARGVTHLFVTWSGSVAMLARHLHTRALTPDFPDIVADYADTIAPLSTRKQPNMRVDHDRDRT